MATVTVYETIDTNGGSLILFAGITGTNVYALGGFSVSAADCGLNAVKQIYPLAQANGYVTSWDNANTKLLIHGQGNASLTNGCALAQMQAAVNFMSITIPVIIIGKPNY